MTLGLLLLHAFPLDADMWDDQVSALSPLIPVVPVNLPGFGGAAAITSADGWMDRAADVADAALSGTGIDRVIVAGLSMGGYVALAYARKHRDKVAGLVLANTRADADDDAAKQRRRDLAERLRKEGNGFLADSPPPLLSPNAPPDMLERVKTIIRRQPAESIAMAALAMASRADSTSDLASFDVPALVVTSSGDTLISPDLSKSMAAALPNATLETIEGAGHLSNLEAPEEFNRRLSAFIEQVKQAEGAA